MDTKDALLVLTLIVHGIGRDLTPDDDTFYRQSCVVLELRDLGKDTPENREAVLALMELVYPSGS